MSESETDKFLQIKEKAFYGKIAGLIVVLSSEQNDRIGDVFLKRKWALKLDGLTNPRSGSKLYMYFRDLNPTAAREKRIFGR